MPNQHSVSFTDISKVTDTKSIDSIGEGDKLRLELSEGIVVEVLVTAVHQDLAMEK